MSNMDGKDSIAPRLPSLPLAMRRWPIANAASAGKATFRTRRWRRRFRPVTPSRHLFRPSLRWIRAVRPAVRRWLRPEQSRRYLQRAMQQATACLALLAGPGNTGGIEDNWRRSMTIADVEAAACHETQGVAFGRERRGPA